MIRKIIEIDTEKCNGCGKCAVACHEGAIGMVNGKAALLRDDYCDGLGDCLPACPAGAISFVYREAAAYNESAVLSAKQAAACPTCESQLRQFPVQIKLVPVNAPWFHGADLLIAADCTAYAYANFHQDFIRNHITLIGCPKLDAIDYSMKLAEILKHNSIHSLTVVRMQVPCCGGLSFAVQKALEASGKCIPLRIITLSTDGKLLSTVSL